MAVRVATANILERVIRARMNTLSNGTEAISSQRLQIATAATGTNLEKGRMTSPMSHSSGSVCDGYHRYFVASDGTIEGIETIKIWVLVICTVCKDSHLVEHIMDKSSTQLTQKGK